MTAPNYAPEAMPSVSLSPIITQRNENIAKAALDNLKDGQFDLFFEAYMIKRHGPRKAAVVLMMIARQCEIAPWKRLWG